MDSKQKPGENPRMPERSATLPTGGYHNQSLHHRGMSAGCPGSSNVRNARSNSVDDILMQGLNPNSPSYDDILPDEHNYRTAERSEVRYVVHYGGSLSH